MCIGLPMQVIEVDGYRALCQGMGERRWVDTLLVGEQKPGAWLLVFLDSAREVLTADDAQRIGAALQAVQLAMQGETDIDHLFADLNDAPARLPDFLKHR